MTEQLNSSNTWDWNCGSKNDLDYRIIWGSNGGLTIQRNYLRKIIYALDCWNEIDGRVQKSSTIELPSPTSLPQTFPGVSQHYCFARGAANLYWAKYYTMTGKLVIISGNRILVDEEVITTVNGCFSGLDPNFADDVFPGCTPPHVECSKLITGQNRERL